MPIYQQPPCIGLICRYVCNDGSKKSDEVKDLITCVVVNSGKICTMLASLCGCTGNFLATDILGVHRHTIDCHPESTKIKHTKINQ